MDIGDSRTRTILRSLQLQQKNVCWELEDARRIRHASPHLMPLRRQRWAPDTTQCACLSLRRRGRRGSIVRLYISQALPSGSSQPVTSNREKRCSRHNHPAGLAISSTWYYPHRPARQDPFGTMLRGSKQRSRETPS